MKQLAQGHTASVTRICTWVCLSQSLCPFHNSVFIYCPPILLWPVLGQASLGTQNCIGKVPTLQVSFIYHSLNRNGKGGSSAPSAGVSEPQPSQGVAGLSLQPGFPPWDHSGTMATP